MLAARLSDIEANYSTRPLIDFADPDIRQTVAKVLRERGMDRQRLGFSLEIQEDIRVWSYGLLILGPKDCTGLNTRFAIDSLVLIAARMADEAQYVQAKGRSSMSRGLCKSIYYPVTTLGPQQVLQQLRNTRMEALHDLASLVKVIRKKDTAAFSQKPSNQHLMRATRSPPWLA